MPRKPPKQEGTKTVVFKTKKAKKQGEKKKKTGTDLFGDADIYHPIQVKQKDKAGRPDIDSFAHAIHRDGRRKGFFISFDYTTDAITEIKRLDKVGEVEIVPIKVKDLLRRESFT